jgi:hypothetical protein
MTDSHEKMIFFNDASGKVYSANGILCKAHYDVKSGHSVKSNDEQDACDNNCPVTTYSGF